MSAINYYQASLEIEATRKAPQDRRSIDERYEVLLLREKAYPETKIAEIKGRECTETNKLFVVYITSVA